MSVPSRVLSGRYRVEELLGRGGMASVYQGYDETLGRTVAIKLLKRELADDATFRTRFRLEAQAASRMANPTIVRVYDAGEDIERDADGTAHPVPFIVMELVHGRLLKDVIAAGPVAEADAVRWVDGILEALEYSHRAGVVHRDIKPGNVMITDAGQVKVMDFGIARAVSDSSSTVAETTTILGTAAYFSPEQAKGEPVDARADIYSTGVVLYELLTGQPPFRGETPVAVAYQHVSETPVPPSEIEESVPRSLDTVVLRALAKDPFQRYPDAAAFREALDATVDGRVPSKRRVSALTSELYGPDPRHAAEMQRSLRQLSTDTTMRRTQAGPPVAWIWSGVAFIAFVLIAVLFWVMTIPRADNVPTSARLVPDLTGMTFDRASATLADQDLVAVRTDEPNADVAAGNVTRTDPAAGVAMEANQQVRVFVSSGQQLATVPTLAGLSQEAAASALQQAGLVVGTVSSRTDPDAAAGTVLGADQTEGGAVPLGTTVNLTIASGQIAIDDVTGYTVDAATRYLESAEVALVVTAIADPGCAKSPGGEIVVSQSIPPGLANIHSPIDITYCTG